MIYLRTLLGKFENFEGRSLITLKTLPGHPSSNLKFCREVFDKFKKLCREVLDKFKNFTGRSIIKLKYLQRGS